MASNIRRHYRAALRAPVRVIWFDRYGTSRLTNARTLDISESGIRVEMPEPVEIRGIVGLQAERLGLACNGSVRSCVRCGAKYHVGIEFNAKVRLKGEAADAINAGATPVLVAGDVTVSAL